MVLGKMALTGGVDPEARLGHPVSDDAAPESEAGASEVVAVPRDVPAEGFSLLLWRLGGLLVKDVVVELLGHGCLLSRNSWG